MEKKLPTHIFYRKNVSRALVRLALISCRFTLEDYDTFIDTVYVLCSYYPGKGLTRFALCTLDKFRLLYDRLHKDFPNQCPKIGSFYFERIKPEYDCNF